MAEAEGGCAVGGCAMGGGGRWVRWGGKREKRSEGRKRDYRERECE